MGLSIKLSKVLSTCFSDSYKGRIWILYRYFSSSTTFWYSSYCFLNVYKDGFFYADLAYYYIGKGWDLLIRALQIFTNNFANRGQRQILSVETNVSTLGRQGGFFYTAILIIKICIIYKLPFVFSWSRFTLSFY